MSILALDHLVLTVASIDRTCTFYCDALGMRKEIFGPLGRVALKFGDQKINLHQAGHEFEPKSRVPTPGSADLCFLVGDVVAVRAAIVAAGVEIIEGPVMRTGATGPINSIYMRDPDGNLIEVSELVG